MQNYQEFIEHLVANIECARELPLGAAAPCPRPDIDTDARRVVIFSPHPDDECIIGALPLRLLRQNRMKVINVAVTQGSRKDRQAARFDELRQACDFLGLDLLQTLPGGLERVKPETPRDEPEYWNDCVKIIANILCEISPDIVFMPHGADWNGTHIGTHYLVRDALTAMPGEFSCTVIETEYWQPMSNPNLMVECSTALLADLICGLTFHKGEVARNPYHLSLPAWMQDNVRRGSELVGGQGEAAPDMLFATLYRISFWKGGALSESELPSKLLLQESCFQ